MPLKNIFFHSEDCSFELKNKTGIRAWLNGVAADEGFEINTLNFIFCSDEYLLRLNQQYLDHDTYTDVITFDHSERLKIVLGDIFISIDRVRENAAMVKVSANHELCRVMVHGTLHLLGYKDKTKAEKTLMTEKEDHYLQKLL